LQAYGAGLVTISQQYLRSLAALVGSSVNETPKTSGWNVKGLQIRDLLADKVRREGWIRAISEFQSGECKEVIAGPNGKVDRENRGRGVGWSFSKKQAADPSVSRICGLVFNGL
jgi:hypothetical protein